MAEYRLVTVWRVEAPLHAVWKAIYRSQYWPNWWKGAERVLDLEPGDDIGVGSRRRYTWKSRLPYRLTFDVCATRVEPHVALEGSASGAVEGTGRWTFSTHGAVTTVRYEWHVRTTKCWMNLLAPFARPLFRWNHDAVMRQGGEGLARLLDARLISVARD